MIIVRTTVGIIIQSMNELWTIIHNKMKRVNQIIGPRVHIAPNIRIIHNIRTCHCTFLFCAIPGFHPY